MPERKDEHTLEFLLAFDGRVHRYEGGYWLKFEIAKVEDENRSPQDTDYDRPFAPDQH